MNEADRRLAVRLAAVLGISGAEALAAVRELGAERARRAALPKYKTSLACIVRDSDAATGADSSAPTKQCGHCAWLLPVDCFTTRKIARDGLSAWCRSCTKDYRAERTGRTPRAPRPPITDEQRQQVLALLETAATYDAITAATGVSRAAITRINRAAGNGSRQRSLAVTDQQRAHVAAMLAAGEPRRVIVAATGLSISSVARIRKQRLAQMPGSKADLPAC